MITNEVFSNEMFLMKGFNLKWFEQRSSMDEVIPTVGWNKFQVFTSSVEV